MRAAERRPCFLLVNDQPLERRIRTNVYIDGFNLYYGAVRGTPYKWLDLRTLTLELLPAIQVNRIRYFTALVSPMPSDLQKRTRQEIYIRALKTIPGLAVHYGHYLQSVVQMKLANALPGSSQFAEVLKMEEKGSDVNIATYMLVDAFRADCEQLVLITNDSDLAEPVRIINQELKMPVVVLNPHTLGTAKRQSQRTGRPLVPPKPSIQLKKSARFYREIGSDGPDSHVAKCQLPDVITDADGRTIRKPHTW